MHWLQRTYATRFNRLRSERGHLFQGRYRALLIEDAAVLGRVADYIHLNPVRGGIVHPIRYAGRSARGKRISGKELPSGASCCYENTHAVGPGQANLAGELAIVLRGVISGSAQLLVGHTR